MKEILLDGICCPMCRGSLQFQRVNRRQKEDVLSEEEQKSYLNQRALPLGKTAILDALPGCGFHIKSVLDGDSRWGQWYVVAAGKSQ